MRFLDVTLPTLAENLALDEALVLDAEETGNEVLRLWSWPRHAVVLGAGARLADEVHEDACRAGGVPILRRSSGGGTVLLGEGCLIFSLVLSFDRDPALADLHASYRYILGRIQRALTPLLPSSLAHDGLRLQGISDLAIGARKCSGNSQQRKRTHLLHHGTLLTAFDAAPIARYLKEPTRQPEYRRGRPHADFVMNLPIAADILKHALRDDWDAKEMWIDWPGERALTLAREKYETAQWTRRR